MWSNQGGWSGSGWGRALAASGALSLPLDFTTGTMPAGVTFTRSTTGTRFNSSGVLVTEAIDTARLEYNPSTLSAKGLLLEPARTNLVPNSNSFSNWNDFSSNAPGTGGALLVTANSRTSPDGTTSAATLDEAALSSNHYRYQGPFSTGTGAGNPFTASVFFEAGTGTIGQISMTNANAFFVNFDLSGSGAVSQTGSANSGFYVSSAITPLGSGRFRASVTGFFSTDATSYFLLGLNTALTNGAFMTYTGTNKTIYAYGAQLESGSYATSYIPTTSVAVARGADAASFVIPAGVTNLRTTYEDNTTSDATGLTPGNTYNIPTGQKAIKTIASF